MVRITRGAPHGFTLIELLVVIAILGVLVVGLMVAIDPADKINAAGDSRTRSDFGAIARATEAYVTSNGYYPAALSDLTTTTTQELKVVPIPTGNVCGATTATNIYDGGTNCDMVASIALTPPTAFGACTTALKNCLSVIMTAPLKSKKYSATPFLRYESSTGKTCQVLTAATVC